MEENNASGASPCGLFIFISPAAVICECFSTEQIWFFRSGRRIIYEHHQHLATVVIGLTFIVIPPLVRRRNAVTDKNQISINVDSFFLGAGKGYEVVGKIKDFGQLSVSTSNGSRVQHA